MVGFGPRDTHHHAISEVSLSIRQHAVTMLRLAVDDPDLTRATHALATGAQRGPAQSAQHIEHRLTGTDFRHTTGLQVYGKGSVAGLVSLGSNESLRSGGVFRPGLAGAVDGLEQSPWTTGIDGCPRRRFAEPCCDVRDPLLVLGPQVHVLPQLLESVGEGHRTSASAPVQKPPLGSCHDRLRDHRDEWGDSDATGDEVVSICRH